MDPTTTSPSSSRSRDRGFCSVLWAAGAPFTQWLRGPSQRLWQDVLSLVAAVGSLIVIVTCSAQRGTLAATTSTPSMDAAAGLEEIHHSTAPSVPSADTNERPASESRQVGTSRTAHQDTSPGEYGVDAESDSCFQALRHWRVAMRELAAGRRSQSVRALWLGDSHTAADFWTNSVRRILEQRVPSGGPGFLALGLEHYRHGSVRVNSTGSFDVAPHPLSRRSPEGDGVFGLGGIRSRARGSGSSALVRLELDPAHEQMAYAMAYRLLDADDRVEVSWGSQHRRLQGPQSEKNEFGISHFEFDGDAADPIEIRALSGQPQLFGIIAETTSPGLVIDTLGINGARFATMLAWNSEAWLEEAQRREPVLAIIAYGTNEIFDAVAPEKHAQELQRIIAQVRSAGPSVDCLVAGPTDTGRGGPETAMRAAALDQVERDTARRAGCCYFSPFQLMNREGGFPAWLAADPPLAVSDQVHLTVRGYERLGQALAEILLRGW